MCFCLFEGKFVKFMNSQESGKNPALTETERQRGGRAFLRSVCVHLCKLLQKDLTAQSSVAVIHEHGLTAAMQSRQRVSFKLT